MKYSTVIKFGQVWQHYKGNLYTTLGVAETEKGVKVVVYQSESGNLYTRLLTEWESIINKQNGTRRFVLQPDPTKFFRDYGIGNKDKINTLATVDAKKVLKKFNRGYKTIGRIYKQLANVQSFAHDEDKT